MLKWLKSLFLALALSIPTFGEKEEGKHDFAPVERDRGQRLAPGGQLQETPQKHYGITIAGGPGSQDIYKAFEALPQAQRDAMIAARKGVVRPVKDSDYNRDEDDTKTETLSRGIAKAVAKNYRRPA